MKTVNYKCYDPSDNVIKYCLHCSAFDRCLDPATNEWEHANRFEHYGTDDGSPLTSVFTDNIAATSSSIVVERKYSFS